MYFCDVLLCCFSQTPDSYICLLHRQGPRAYTSTHRHTHTHGDTHTRTHTHSYTHSHAHTHRLALLVSSDGRIAAVSCLSSQLNSRLMALLRKPASGTRQAKQTVPAAVPTRTRTDTRVLTPTHTNKNSCWRGKPCGCQASARAPACCGGRRAALPNGSPRPSADCFLMKYFQSILHRTFPYSPMRLEMRIGHRQLPPIRYALASPRPGSG